MIDNVWTDVRLAARSLRRTPAFTAAAVITLAIGIGANTAIFSLMDVVMLRPLNVRAPGELWQVGDRGPAAPGDTQGGTGVSEILPWPLIEQFRRVLPHDASIAAMTEPSRLNLRLGRDDTTTLVMSQLVSGTFFSTFGVQPAAGRLLTDQDMRVIDGEPIAVIGYALWQRQFGGSPSAIGRTIAINRLPFTIVGVAAKEFRGVFIDSTVDVWVPLVMQNALGYSLNASTNNARDDVPWSQQMNVSWLNAVVRAREDQRPAIEATLAPLHAAAMREVAGDRQDATAKRLRERTLMTVSFTHGYSNLRDQFSIALRLLMGMVTLLLFAACANVANLMLARWSARQREVAIRVSIGAARARVIRHLFAESLLLGVFGAAAGLLVAQWTSTSLAEAAQIRDLLPASVAFDARVLIFCTIATLATIIVFGLMPAFRASAASPAIVLARSGARSGRQTSVMRPLVAAQVAFSVVLVVGALLFARSLINLREVDPGYDRDHLVQVRMDPLAGGVKREELSALYRSIVQRAREVPGVKAAEVSRIGVASGRRSIGRVDVEGYRPAPGEVVRFMFNSVGPAYFATTGMTVLAGRAFTDRDVAGQPPVAIINEIAARRYFGNAQRALGKHVSSGAGPLEIVGVVRDARVMSLHEAPTPMGFAPLPQSPTYPQALEVRVAGDAARIGEAVRRAVTALEPRLVTYNRPTIVADSLERGLARDRLLAGLAIAFAGVALLLACVGLYGVLSYAVARRQPEIGVRMALGASPGDVQRVVMAEGLRLAAAGVVIGAAAAMAIGRLVQSLLFGVSSSDPATYAVVIAALLAIAAAASFLPARRAAHVDPMTALRAE